MARKTKKAKRTLSRKVAGKKTGGKGATERGAKGAPKLPRAEKPKKEKKERGPTFASECLKLLVEGGRTDEAIRAELEKKFPDANGAKGTTHIKWYRSRLNAGKFEEKGFKAPAKPIKAVREHKEKKAKKTKVLSRKSK